jgi:hypothetical protein
MHSHLLPARLSSTDSISRGSDKSAHRPRIQLAEREAEPVPLDADTANLLDVHIGTYDAVRTVIFGRCWADSPWIDDLRVSILAGETIGECAERLDLSWNPRWLLDAGYDVLDSAGIVLGVGGRAGASGPVNWVPDVRIPKVDDQVADGVAPGDPKRARRLMGEVAVAALWRRAAQQFGIGDDIRPLALGGGQRGARFKNAVVYYSERVLPSGWSVKPELRLDAIRGLHLRRDVGERQSDIAVFDDTDAFMAMVSSKWTWRSDRGTEAAQIIAVRRYRPDLPYLLVTSEFPRAPSLVRESVEDLVFHTCPGWVGAWTVLYRSPLGEGRRDYASLDDLYEEGLRAAGPYGIAILDLADLPNQLGRSGRVG